MNETASTLNKAYLDNQKRCEEIAYGEPTFLERLEQEQESLIKRLSMMAEKIRLIKADPTLAEKIELFNRY